MNAYVTVNTLKGTGALNISGTAYDARLRRLAENVSRQIDRYCNRVYYFFTATRTFDGDGSTELFVPDLVSVTSLKEDSNDDGTFDKTWGGSDYILYPLNAQPTAEWGRPYSRIQVSLKTGGTQDVFLGAQKNYEIVATWGYRQYTEDSGRNGTLADGTATSMTLDGSASALEVGQTILIGTEQVYVTATAGTAATVIRAVNGSTGTAHTNVDCDITKYPGPVEEAAFIQTARLWRRKDSGFAQTVGMPETGQETVWRGGLDADVKDLLNGYRKPAIGWPI